ncbi:uncharacterized protein LOC118781041 isoform X2 [Megalops cyprinoides]|uniref:uncharacterized protein LOC118781041 isoform X2 n=1 Tax=Megalops cyprinoides TaxID=118141 RepID=UPI00186421F6|nr:uncharacterized protein LOC118781041 isoform X2 [Megalops cyprinoides]
MAKMQEESDSGDVSAERLLPSPSTVPADQEGLQAGYGERLAPGQEAGEGWRSGAPEPQHNSASSTAQRPPEELLLRSFQIPRKNKEAKALFQYLLPDSHEFNDIVSILCSSYLEPASAGTFTYAKARFVHSELLEKEFFEKKREMKQESRSDSELLESYCFLLTDSSKMPGICEKGLCVGHSRITTLGNPAMGVYLSRYSDLLHMNPFPVGVSGEIIIFKVIRGRVRSFEIGLKNVLDPSPNYDCHVSKKASRVPSLLSYRAFEITQQYFYEYAFDEIRLRPRHVCPYAVVSFLYTGQQGAPLPKPAAPFRCAAAQSVSSEWDSSSVITVLFLLCYCVKHSMLLTVFSLLPGHTAPALKETEEGAATRCGAETCRTGARWCPECTCVPLPAPSCPSNYVLEMDMAIQLDQVKQKIPAALFSWNTYSGTREVLRTGLYGSLLEVVDFSKQSSALVTLLLRLERERMVLLKPLIDGGFLFLLSSAQMVSPSVGDGEWAWRLQALFIFREPRGVSGRMSGCGVTPDAPLMAGLGRFLPALHYALRKLRSADPPDPPDPAAGVACQAQDYLRRCGAGLRPYYMSEYQQNLDEKPHLYPAPRENPGLDGRLRAYLTQPTCYCVPVAEAQAMVDSSPPPQQLPPERCPATDTRGSNDQPGGQKGAGVWSKQKKGRGLPQGNYDQAMVKELLKVIRNHKKKLGKDVRVESWQEAGSVEGQGVGPDDWQGAGLLDGVDDLHGLKRKLGNKPTGVPSKCQRMGLSSLLSDKLITGDKGNLSSTPSLSTFMAGRDSDLRGRGIDLMGLDSHLRGRDIDLMGLDSDLRGQDCGLRRRDSDLRGHDSDLGELDSNTETLLNILLATLKHTMTPSSPTEPAACSVEEPGAAESLPHDGCLSGLGDFGLPAGCDIDLRKRLVPESQEELSRLEDQAEGGASPQGGTRLEMPSGEQSHEESYLPWRLIPITGMKSEGYRRLKEGDPLDPRILRRSGPRVRACRRRARRALSEPAGDDGKVEGSLDGVLEEELSSFSGEVQEVLVGAGVPYSSETPAPHCSPQVLAFSQYVLELAPPVSVKRYIRSLWEGMNRVIGSQSAPAPCVAQPPKSESAPPTKPSSAPPTKPPSDPRTKPSSAPPTKLPSDPRTKPSSASPIKPSSASPTKPSSASPTKPESAPPTKSPSAPPTKAPSDPRTKPPSDPHTKSSSASPTKPPSDPRTKPPSDPRTKSSSASPTKPPSDPRTKPPSDPRTKSSSASPTKPPSDPRTKPSSAPPTKPSSAPPTKPSSAPHTKSESAPPKTPKTRLRHRHPSQGVVREKHPQPLVGKVGRTGIDSGKVAAAGEAAGGTLLLGNDVPAPDPAPRSTSISSLIGQVGPEVVRSLVEIIQDVRKNSVKFYIHPGSQDAARRTMHREIKEYLRSLGNKECDPETFLQRKNSLEKLLVIIQNQDIATHLHKIPALVSLKRLCQSVSFAGVDSPDDVRNHNYNEVFVSGGIIVSDDFVLSPDFITHARLQALLMSLEGRSSSENLWQWKIHLKTQKKLKELSRLNAEAVQLLRLLSTYQKRRVVEVLPYHECDGSACPTPDLDCLIRLQAENTQQRHFIFLTERRFEMFSGYSDNGIVVASVDDVMTRFENLVGTGGRELPNPTHPNAQTPPASQKQMVRKCVHVIKHGPVQEGDVSQEPVKERPTSPPEDTSCPPPPKDAAFQPPLPKEAALQPPLPKEAALQPPLPKEAVLQPPLPKDAALQPLLPKEAVLQPPLPKEAVLQPPLPKEAVLQPPLPKDAALQPPLPKEAIFQPPLPKEAAFQPPLPKDAALQLPLPQEEQFHPPLPEQRVLDPGPQAAGAGVSAGAPERLHMEALQPVCQFSASGQAAWWSLESVVGGAFGFNPHQSLVSPASLWTPPAYPAPTQELDCTPPTLASAPSLSDSHSVQQGAAQPTLLLALPHPLPQLEIGSGALLCRPVRTGSDPSGCEPAASPGPWPLLRPGWGGGERAWPMGAGPAPELRDQASGGWAGSVTWAGPGHG